MASPMRVSLQSSQDSSLNEAPISLNLGLVKARLDGKMSIGDFGGHNTTH